MTRSDVVLVGPDGSVAATTLAEDLAATVAHAGGAPRLDDTGKARTIEIDDAGRLWSAATSMGPAGTAYFVRFADREFTALPRLRRAALIGAGLAVLVVLLVGSMLASRLARPISELAARLTELHEANEALEERQRRLQALQAEIVQHDQLVAAGRLVTELAYEIRNPVANVRNRLKVVRRRIDDGKAVIGRPTIPPTSVRPSSKR